MPRVVCRWASDIDADGFDFGDVGPVVEFTADDAALLTLASAIVAGDANAVSRLLGATPMLARASLHKGVTRETANQFLGQFGRYFYAGDTALHAVAGAYRLELVRQLLALGADLRARNRLGSEPLHAAAVGIPGSDGWDPEGQAATIARLIHAGADPNAVDNRGVTPLHRAVRTRCASAVSALLAGGADPRRANGNGTTPMALATQNTGRGGSGSPAAKAQQREIIGLLDQALS